MKFLLDQIVCRYVEKQNIRRTYTLMATKQSPSRKGKHDQESSEKKPTWLGIPTTKACPLATLATLATFSTLTALRTLHFAGLG